MSMIIIAIALWRLARDNRHSQQQQQRHRDHLSRSESKVSIDRSLSFFLALIQGTSLVIVTSMAHGDKFIITISLLWSYCFTIKASTCHVNSMTIILSHTILLEMGHSYLLLKLQWNQNQKVIFSCTFSESFLFIWNRCRKQNYTYNGQELEQRHVVDYWMVVIGQLLRRQELLQRFPVQGL